MMDCSIYKELSGLRPEDLLDEERQQLMDHLAHCDPCNREQRFDEELLALVDSWPALESRITAADIRASDGMDAVDAAPVTTPPAPRRSARLVPIALALAALVLLCLFLAPRLGQEDSDPTYRLKGASADPTAPVSLDLQLSVETSLMGTPVLAPGQEAGTYGPGEGLLFGVRTDSKGTLVLAEQTPDGALNLLGPHDDSVWTRGPEGTLALVDGTGRRLAYQPDAGPGTYRFTALLIEPSATAADEAAVKSLLEGEEVSGISLLATDSFAIEWSAGVDGDQAY